MPGEPTLGELSRQILALTQSIQDLSNKVLTTAVWQAERAHLETRLRENEKDIAALEAKTEAERVKREQEKREAEAQALGFRRQIIIALVTAVAAPIFVGVVLAVVLGS